MSLAKEVNEHLDNILAIRAEIRKMESEIKDNQTLTNKTTGEVMNKREVVSFVEKTIDDIKIWGFTTANSQLIHTNQY